MISFRSRFLIVGILTAALGACAPVGGTSRRGTASETSTTASTEASADPATSTTVATATPTPTSPAAATCSRQTIDYGTKMSSANTARGAYSDIKLYPGTSNPVIAYTDPSAVSIKLAYWNGSSYTVEVVSGDGTGAFVRLAMLSDGRPIVLWTLGTAVKAAVRSAALTSTGTWSAGVIDTGTAPRAIEVSVSPQDTVGIAYLTDTLATGRARFAYCSSPCNSPSGFITMTPNLYIENQNIVAAQVGIGFGWCKASANTYVPAMVYGNSAPSNSLRYAVCNQTSLSSCRSNTNWSAGQIAALAVTSSKLLLDSSVTTDVPKAALGVAAGIQLYGMGSSSCTSPAAFTAGATVGAANYGNQRINLAKDATGKFHLMANNTTTNALMYFNSQTTTFTGAWNTVGTVDSIAPPAAHAGGAVYDSLSNTVMATYAQNAAPYDARVAMVNDITVASNSATFQRTSFDTTGNLVLSAASLQFRGVRGARTSTGVTGVAWTDFSIGAAANARLKYALKSNGEYPVIVVPGTGNPQYPWLAYDKDDKPWISYFDANVNRFYLVTNSLSDGSGSWSSYEFPLLPSGAPAALPAANNTSVTMRNVSGVLHPVMTVVDTNATSRGVKVALLNWSTRIWSGITTVDALSTSAGSFVAANSDSSGNVALAYYNQTTTRVAYSQSADGSTWSSPLPISGPAMGQGIDIAFNPVSGLPTVSYFDRAANGVYVATCGAAAFSGCSSGGWGATQVETAAGVSGITTTQEQLLSTGLMFHPDRGEMFVGYVRGATGNAGLNLATNWLSSSYSNVYFAGGANGSITGAPSFNFGIAGWMTSLVRNSANGITAFFIGPGAYLETISCGE